MDKQFASFERALRMCKVGNQHWRSLLWELVPVVGSNTLLTLEEWVAESNQHMKDILVEKLIIPQDSIGENSAITTKMHNSPGQIV